MLATDSLSRPNRFEIDLGAISHNVGEVRRLVGGSTQIIAALKANAYGFGLVEVAETAVSSGVDAIAVADLSDAVLLRERGIRAPILLYAGNSTNPQTVAAVQAHDLMPTIFDIESARVYSSQANRTIRAFVKVDVGLERLGIETPAAAAFIKVVRELPNLEVHGVYAHVDVPEAEGAERYINWQFERYSRVCGELEGEGIRIPVKMVASSAVLGFSPTMSLSAVDPGHMLFGLLPPGPRAVEIDLRPAFHALRSCLIHTRAIERTEFIDMAAFPIREGMRFGIIPIGLRDGMGSISCGRVLVRGESVPVLGSPSLEHTRVDLTDVPTARVGDEVVLVGAQGENMIGVDEVGARQGFTVKAQMALAVRESVPRIYI